MPMLDKVRVTKPRPPEATPKEKQAWESFTELAQSTTGKGEKISPIVMAELERLCAKGNPIALRFKERLDVAQFQPRKADELPLAAPEPRRISGLQWGRPKG